MINSKWFRRKQSWPNRSTIPEFSCRVWWKPRKTSVRTPCDPDEIRSEHFLNASLERRRYTRNFSLRSHQHLRGWPSTSEGHIFCPQAEGGSWWWRAGTTGEMWNTYKYLVWESETKRSLTKLRSGWEDNIKIVLKKYGVSYGLIRYAQNNG
jgi:hypothetical protein